MKLTIPDISQQNEWDDAKRFVSISFERIQDLFSNNITFGDNFNGQIVSAVFATANAEVTIAHTLNRVPTGFIPVLPSVAMSVYNGSTPWTASSVYLKSTVAGNCNILVF